MIELTNVSKYYKGETYNICALNNISLKIDNGEFVAIMGKSGSGKSTLLRIMGAIEAPDEGRCVIEGSDISNLKPYQMDSVRKENISFVFQNFELIKEFSVYENIEVPLDAFGMGNKEKIKRINEVLEKLDILELRDMLPRQISGGEQQRTAIARAIVKKGNYILADEPTGALDKHTAMRIMEYFKAINEDGKTIVVVTHDNDVAKYAKRIITLDDGMVV